MLASNPTSILNQTQANLGNLNRFSPRRSRSNGVAIDDEGVGLCHGTRARSGRVGLSRVRPRGCGFLKVVQKIYGALRVGRCAEYRALVALQRLNPRSDIGSVIFANLWRQVEVGRQEGGAKLGDELLNGITFIAEALACEVAVEARGVAGRMRLMPISA
jgi:hypothetical protein